MPTEIVNAKISFVSLVDKAANKKQFAIIKSDVTPTFQKQVSILKSDDEKKIVTGVVYEPDILDAHGEYMTADEIEKAAHQFLKDFRNVDKQHDFESGYGEVVESWITKASEKLGEQEVAKGTWLMSVHVADDATWESIKKGEITGFSMGGVGEKIKHDDISKSETDEVKGFFNVVKEFFNGKKAIQKGEVKDRYNKDSKRRNFWAAQDALNSVIFNWRSYDEDIETDPEKIREALQDFITISEQVLTSGDIIKAIGKPPEEITKAGKKISTANMGKINAALDALQEIKNQVEGEDEDVKKEDIEKMLDEKLDPVIKRLEKFEKDEKDEQPEPAENETKPDDVMKQFEETLDTKLAPLTERLDAVEKTRGISKQTNEPNQEPIEKHYLSGIL